MRVRACRLSPPARRRTGKPRFPARAVSVSRTIFWRQPVRPQPLPVIRSISNAGRDAQCAQTGPGSCWGRRSEGFEAWRPRRASDGRHSVRLDPRGRSIAAPANALTRHVCSTVEEDLVALTRRLESAQVWRETAYHFAEEKPLLGLNAYASFSSAARLR